MQVLMDHFLHLLELVLDSEELVSFEWVLPLSQIDLEGSKLKGVVCGEGLVENASGLELVPELHDEFIQEGVGSTLVVLVISDGCGSDSVKSDPAMALADIVFE